MVGRNLAKSVWRGVSGVIPSSSDVRWRLGSYAHARQDLAYKLYAAGSPNSTGSRVALDGIGSSGGPLG